MISPSGIYSKKSQFSVKIAIFIYESLFSNLYKLHSLVLLYLLYLVQLVVVQSCDK